MEAIKRLAMDKVEGKSKVPLPDEDLDIPLPELEGSNGSRDWSEEYSNMGMYSKNSYIKDFLS